MKVFENYADQSNSENEAKRLKKLQQGIAKEAAEKRYSEQEQKSMKSRTNNFRNRIKDRAQPLRTPDNKFAKMKKGFSKIGAVTNVMSKINWSQDGLYFIVFLISIVGDVGTAIIGLAEGATAGVVALLFGVQMEMFVFGISATIMMLYIMNKHYARHKKILKIAVLIGFSVTELMPIATALPGFIGSFIINYAIVLYGRAMDEAIESSGNSVAKVYSFVAGKKGRIGNRIKN